MIFLDIEMDGFTGIQLLESINNKPEVILSTAYNHYALKGFDLNVSDYLLKPYSFERFMQAVSKVYSKLNLNIYQPNTAYIFIKTEYRLEKIFTNQILYIEGKGDYRQIHAIDKKIMTLDTFGDLEKILYKNEFCRVHKSFMVSISKIESIERDRIKIGTALIPISETYKEKFYKLIATA